MVGALWQKRSHLWQVEFFQVSIQESYAVGEWRDDLKKVSRRVWHNGGLTARSSRLIVKQR